MSTAGQGVQDSSSSGLCLPSPHLPPPLPSSSLPPPPPPTVLPELFWHPLNKSQEPHLEILGVCCPLARFLLPVLQICTPCWAPMSNNCPISAPADLRALTSHEVRECQGQSGTRVPSGASGSRGGIASECGPGDRTATIWTATAWYPVWVPRGRGSPCHPAYLVQGTPVGLLLVTEFGVLSLKPLPALQSPHEPLWTPEH